MIRPLHVETPVLESRFLTSRWGKPVFLKMEFFQPSGSFKIRGLGHLAQYHAQNGISRLVAASGGNAGYATAYAARKLGLRCTVFMPETARPVFIRHIQSEGAEIIMRGQVWDEANQAAKQFVYENNAGFVPSFDHPLIFEGHGTLVHELKHQMTKPGGILVAVGGGGLACGIIEGLHRYGWKDVPVYAVEPQGAAALAASLKAGKLVMLDQVNTIATSLATKRVTSQILEWSEAHTIIPLQVTDEDMQDVAALFARDHRLLIEPACAAALTPVYKNYPEIRDLSSVLVVVCGGVGADTSHLLAV